VSKGQSAQASWETCLHPREEVERRDEKPRGCGRQGRVTQNWIFTIQGSTHKGGRPRRREKTWFSSAAMWVKVILKGRLEHGAERISESAEYVRGRAVRSKINLNF